MYKRHMEPLIMENTIALAYTSPNVLSRFHDHAKGAPQSLSSSSSLLDSCPLSPSKSLLLPILDSQSLEIRDSSSGGDLDEGSPISIDDMWRSSRRIDDISVMESGRHLPGPLRSSIWPKTSMRIFRVISLRMSSRHLIAP